MSVIIDGSAGVTTNAGGSVNPSTTIDGINYSCRAWVNFNGSGTVAIRASGNVTSITDNGTGNYSINFTNAMPDANYAVVAAGNKNDPTGDGFGELITGTTTIFQTASAARIFTASGGTRPNDSPQVSVAIFR